MKPAIACMLGLGVAAMAAAQEQAKPPAPPACTAPEARQFDFWLGDWVVHAGDDGNKLAGHNRIDRSEDGCRIREHWRGASGFTGESLNAWDSQYKVWRQFWVGADGVVLRLEGGLREDGAMVMAGELPGADGGVQRQRITWTPRDDGSVVQLWETSDDDGASWQVAFRGVYRHPDAG